jgi:outer membrane protein assembly factor BamA
MQSYGIITTADQQNYAVTNDLFELFTSVNRKNPITLGLRVGGGLSTGDLPFYKALNLGQNNHLRGFVSNRFSGEKSLFFNSSLRFQLGQSMTALFPIKYGINAFYDLGKVFVDGENSTIWHRGYGGGFYLVPLEERFVFSLNAAFSQEESFLVLFSLGRVF